LPHVSHDLNKIGIGLLGNATHHTCKF
jgi:hypothetical protein